VTQSNVWTSSSRYRVDGTLDSPTTPCFSNTPCLARPQIWHLRPMQTPTFGRIVVLCRFATIGPGRRIQDDQ